MKRWFIIGMILSCALCVADESPPKRPTLHDLKVAEKSFQHGLRLEKNGQLDAAFQEFSKAASLAPANRTYFTARELLRNQISRSYLVHGNLLAEIGDQKGAEAQFKSALAIDPENRFVQERVKDVPPEVLEHEHILQLLASVEDVSVTPKPGRANFHIHGDIRELYEAIGRAFGVAMSYDSTVTPKRVRFDLDDLDFYTAMQLAGKATHTFWAPVASKQVMVAPDTQEMRRQYERMAQQTFYVSNADTPAELNEVANVLKTVFEVKLLSVVPEKSIITVRAPKEQMQAIAGILDDVMRGTSQILLEVKAYEVDYTNLRQNGLALPNSFSVFNVYGALYSALGTSAQSVINQLQQTGTINPATIPTGSLANLQSSPLLQPFIFFGNGYGLTGVTVTPITAQLSSNVSYTTDLEDMTLHASNGHAATLMIGTRYPISVGSFTNVAISTSGTPQVGSAIPQIQYEDLGVILKTTPHLQTEDHVNLDLELQIKGLGAQQLNGIPVITNRDYKGSITVKDGEPTEIAGILEDERDKNSAGYPAIGQVPGLNQVINTNSNQHTRTEIVVLITPHIVRNPARQLGNIIWNVVQ